VRRPTSVYSRPASVGAILASGSDNNAFPIYQGSPFQPPANTQAVGPLLKFKRDYDTQPIRLQHARWPARQGAEAHVRGRRKPRLGLVAGHFDSAWSIDQLQSGDADQLEGFTALTYMAALRPQLTFGHTVLCQSFRNPALLAQMGATLQFMSGGRFILGIGAGWNEEEYRAYCYDFPPARVRVDQLEEALQIIKVMWTEETATFEGRYYRVIEARCDPKPDPVPTIMLGAFKPKMLRLTAKYADWWNVSSTGVAGYRRMVTECERACDDVGRDGATLRRSWGGGCACAPTQEEAEAFAGDLYSAGNAYDDFAFVGTPQQLVEQRRPFIDLGVDYFMFDCGGFPKLTTLELLINEVLPALND
jgi:alkanesulfonate monooxygenase SsuD/methylene tetrahydromethanopterin reductase-like flavin-dependent oxidoreductase (luciferase family)